ncbi:MAG: CPBP family intramembrane metalloprotease [Clostridia bacterium]|nr:CPBP family intramembrane metalloprotease [Clostridia bacterium]
MQTPPRRRGSSLLGYALLSSLLIYLAFSFLQTVPLMYGTFALLKTPFLYLMKAAAEGASPEAVMQARMKAIDAVLTTEAVMIFVLFSEMLLIMAVIFYCRKIEKLPVATIGFVRKKAIRDYLVGIVAGALMLSAAVFVCVKAGALTVNVQKNVNVLFVVLYFFAFLVQGMAEEVLFRGYMFRRLCLGYSVFTAAAFNSLFFAIMHLGNGGIKPLAVFNLFAFGLFTSLLVYRCDGSLWCAGALHGVWNFAQGNFFGISVSGNPLMSSVFSSSMAQGRDLTHGGAFGLEGGVAVSLVLVLATAILWMLPQRNASKPIKK